jgi:hypothetical protein
MASGLAKGPRGGRPTEADTQLIQRRRAQVAALRLAGVRSADEIQRALADQGTRVGIRTIKYDLAAAESYWRDAAAKSIEVERAVDVARIERLIRSLWSDATSGRWQAVDRVLKLLERKSALLGLDAPRSIDVTARIREEAERYGVDPEQAVQAAEELVRSMQLR